LTLLGTLLKNRKAGCRAGLVGGDQFGDRRAHTLQKIILHVIAETACSAGHLDAVRELIDGRKWLVLTE
jgi:UDP-N-acetylglucosamine enolpyruvyl transferase